MSNRRQKIRKSILVLTCLLFEYRIFHLFFSPVLVVFAAGKGVVNGSLIIYGLLFLSSLYFGRAWCGWLCPGSAINEGCSMLVRKRPVRTKAYAIKYVVFALWAGLIAVMAIRSGGFHSIDPFFGMSTRSALQNVLLLVGAAAIIAPMSFIFGKYSHCHYMCWLAPIVVIGTRIKEAGGWASLHLEVNREACIKCGKCDRHCPMSLPVTEMVREGKLSDSECILCGSCVDNCPRAAIRFSFKKPGAYEAAHPDIEPDKASDR